MLRVALYQESRISECQKDTKSISLISEEVVINPNAFIK
jgi:hypothetical protein